MLEVKFFSDTNLDGFQDALSLRRIDYRNGSGRWRLQVDDDSDQVRRLVDEWDGEVVS